MESAGAGAVKNPEGDGWVGIVWILWILRRYAPQNDSMDGAIFVAGWKCWNLKHLVILNDQRE